MRARGLRQTVVGAISAALLSTTPAAAQPAGELAAFAHRDGCTAGRLIEGGKLQPLRTSTCREMSRQHTIEAIAGPADASRLYAVDIHTESVVAYQTLAAGGVRELTGPGSCAPLTGARVECALVTGEDYEREYGDAAVSPDGRFLYVATRVGPAPPPQDPPRSTVIDIFSTAGGLARVGCVSSDGTDGRGAPSCATARGLATSTRLVVSPDGRSLYAVSSGNLPGPSPATPPDEGIATFQRDLETGALRQPEGPGGCTTRSGAGGACTADPTMEGANNLAMAPSGDAAFLATGRGGVVVLRRDAATGVMEPARGPGTCLGSVTGRADCTPDAQLKSAGPVTVAPDGRFLYVGAYDAMVLIAVDASSGTITRRGCISNGFPKACARVSTDPSAGRITFAPDGRTALLSDYSDIESLSVNPASGALASRGCTSTDHDEERPPECASPSAPPYLATENPVLAPNGIVYTGRARSINTLAPGASPRPPTSVRPSRGRVLVPVHCYAASACRGTIELEPYDERVGVAPVRLSVPAGRTRNVAVRLPLKVQRAITRHRGLTFLATTRIELGGRRGLASTRPIRVVATGGAGRVSCRSGGVRTLARTSRMRVYTVRSTSYGDVLETTYGCLFSAGRQVRLDEPGTWTAYEPFKLAGSLLAYDHEIAAEGDSDAASFVRVVDLRTGRERRELCAAGPGDCGLESDDSGVHTIVMLPSGGVAWTAATDTEYLVVKADAGGKPRVLDRADGQIRLGSLRLSGNRITWMRNGETRSETLR